MTSNRSESPIARAGRFGFAVVLQRAESAIAAGLVAVLLAGCGGDGSGDGGGDVPPPASTGLQLHGSVVAGPVNGAAIQALCHDSEPAAVIGSAESKSDGGYELETSAACASVVELQASGGTYIDEATGASVTAPGVPWLRTLLDAGVTGAPQVAHITVLTELLYQQVSNGGSNRPSKESLSNAANKLRDIIKQYTGADIDLAVTTPSIVPNASTGGAPTAYSLLLGAMSKLSTGTATGSAAAVSSVREKGFGRQSPLTDALRYVASSNSMLQRLGVTQEEAGRVVIRAESFVAFEALLPLSVVPDTSTLSCEPMQLQNSLTTLVAAHQEGISGRVLSDLSMVLSGDAYVKALQTWKARCPGLTESLDIFIGAEQAGADGNYQSFVADQRPLRDCASAGGVVGRAIVRGQGHDLCVAWDGQSPPTAFGLSSTEPASTDPAVAFERCVQLSEGPANPLGSRYAIFTMRGTPYLFCGTFGGLSNGLVGWLDRQNIGYYPTTTAGGTGTGTGTGSSGTKSYEELARQDTRLFTGKDFDVRLCTDAVDSLFPNGITGAVEPTWPAPYYGSIVTGMTCSSFGPEKYTWYSERYQTCAANYREADYEAVGRRGYEEKMALAARNLAMGYNARKSADPNNPGQVCKQGGF